MKKYFPNLVLVILVFLVYGNTWMNSFHFDDIPSIIEKPWIRGLDKIPQFIFSIGQRPLVILSFNLNFAMSGFEVWSYHLFNILFHAGMVLLVYRLAFLANSILVSRGAGAGDSIPFLTALIFAVHPLNTQSVTYISSRSSVLAAAFFLGALIIFMIGVMKRQHHGAGSGWLQFAGAAICFLLGLMTKLIIITLPAMLFLFHFYFVSSSPFPGWLRGQMKWVLAAAGILILGLLYQEFFRGGLLQAQAGDQTAAVYFLTQTLVVPLEYFRKMLFPFNLSIDSAFLAFNNWGVVSVLFAWLILGVFVLLLIYVSKRDEGPGGMDKNFKRWAGFGLAWTGITLLPTSSVVPLLDFSVEHRTYLPLVGFSIFTAAVLDGLIRSVRQRSPLISVPTRQKTAVVSACLVLVTVFYSAQTVKRNEVWKNEITLWKDTLDKAPNLIRAYNNLGEAYDKEKKFDLAIAEFEKALKLSPTYFFALNNLGNIYGKKRNLIKATHYFQEALKQKPDYAPAHYNLAKAQHMTAKRDEALESYRKAVRNDPYFERAFYNLAFLALEMNRLDESIEYFLKFIEMQPEHSKARYGLGNGYAAKGQFDQALVQYEKSAQLDPAFLAPRINIGTIYMQTGKMDAAKKTYQKILQVDPGAGGIHKNLGLIYYQHEKDPEKAMYHFQEYLRLIPHAPDSQAILSVLAQLRDQAGPQ